MSNLYGIVPKLLIWIIIDEVDLDLPYGVCAMWNGFTSMYLDRYSDKRWGVLNACKIFGGGGGERGVIVAVSNLFFFGKSPQPLKRASSQGRTRTNRNKWFT
jgi:hypothetical protein